MPNIVNADWMDFAISAIKALDVLLSGFFAVLWLSFVTRICKNRYVGVFGIFAGIIVLFAWRLFLSFADVGGKQALQNATLHLIPYRFIHGVPGFICGAHGNKR